jgi:hypothetical protein
MFGTLTLPSISRKRLAQRQKQLTKAAGRGRKRAEAFVDSLPDAAELRENLTQDRVNEIVRDVRRQAEPLVERATGRRRRSRRRGTIGLAIALVMLTVAIVGFVLWQRREKEPATLIEAPQQPRSTPGNSPEPSSSGGPNGTRGEEPLGVERTHSEAREATPAWRRAPEEGQGETGSAGGGPIFPSAYAPQVPFAQARPNLPSTQPFTPR